MTDEKASTPVVVRAIRQVRSGVQCEVHVGFSVEEGDVWLQITARDAATMKALRDLETALVNAGDRILHQAQADAEKRGRRVIGEGRAAG